MNIGVNSSNELSQSYWQESFDDDSFASQSRFDAYADLMIVFGTRGGLAGRTTYANVWRTDYMQWRERYIMNMEKFAI